MELKLKDYQKNIVDHIIANKRSAIFASMGLGKTAATLAALPRLRGPALIIAPKRVALHTWPEEIKKWNLLKGFDVKILIGEAKKRTKIIATTDYDVDTIHIINFELMPWLVRHFDVKWWPYKTMIIDESTKLKSFRTRRGGVTASYISKVAFLSDRFIMLTGTPAPNGLSDLWGQCYFLDKGERLGKFYSHFLRTFFYPSYGFQKPRPYPDAREKIENKISDLCLSIRSSDYMPIVKPRQITVHAYLPSRARKVYDSMEKKFLSTIISEHDNEKSVIAGSVAVKINKLLQISSGILYDESGQWSDIHDAKIDALKDVVDENNGHNLIVAYYYKPDLIKIKRNFRQAKELDSSTIKEWNDGKIPILLIHPAKAGHGLNLHHGGCKIIFYSFHWSLEYHDQTIERIGPARQMMSGYDREVEVYYIQSYSTVDSIVRESLQTKKTLQDLLLKKLAEKAIA